MNFIKKFICLAIGFVVGAAIWIGFGELLRSSSIGALWVGLINGPLAIFGGVIANVAAEKLLGISDEADV